MCDILDRIHGIKRCTKCGYVRKHYKKKAAKDGLKTNCVACDKVCNKAYREANIDTINKQRARYRQANREAICTQQKVYASRNRQKINARDRMRYATDPAHRTYEKISSALNTFMKGGKNGQRTFDIVGCTSGELVEYLDRTMSPETRAALEAGETIDLDHIIPQHAPGIDITNDAHVRALYHYTNFQKLDKPTNIRKSNNVPEGYDTETWVAEQHARIEACQGMKPVDTIPMNAKMLADARTFANSFRR